MTLGASMARLALVLTLTGCAAGTPSDGSIGAILERRTSTGTVVAHRVPEGRSAAVAGLREGDRIKMIDGVLVDELDASQVVALLRGPLGSKVELTVVRGEAVLELVVAREPRGPSVAAVPETQRLE
jgi:C-terminal processing protease CtpA/Prc